MISKAQGRGPIWASCTIAVVPQAYYCGSDNREATRHCQMNGGSGPVDELWRARGLWLSSGSTGTCVETRQRQEYIVPLISLMKRPPG